MHTGVSSVHYITSVPQCSEYCALRCAGNLYCVYLQVHHVMDRMYWWLLGVLVEYRIRYVVRYALAVMVCVKEGIPPTYLCTRTCTLGYRDMHRMSWWW